MEAAVLYLDDKFEMHPRSSIDGIFRLIAGDGPTPFEALAPDAAGWPLQGPFAMRAKESSTGVLSFRFPNRSRRC